MNVGGTAGTLCGMTLDPLLVDAYADDATGTTPAWSTLVAAEPEWVGAFVKATEGLSYDPSWFALQWRSIAAAAGSRLGQSFFRGCYHYLRFALDPAAQADYFLDTVNQAGGFKLGDIYPVVDVESANNGTASADAIVACTKAYVAQLKKRGVAEVGLYGGSLMYDLGITDRMGCDWLWFPRYNDVLFSPTNVLSRIGWDLASLKFWQYREAGGKTTPPPNYPALSPLGDLDTSACVANGGGANAIAWLCGQRSS